MGEVDAGVEDTDGDAAAVAPAVVVDEVHRAGLVGRLVGVLRAGVLPGRRVGALGRERLRAGAGPRHRVGHPYLVVQVDGAHRVEAGGLVDGRVGAAGGHGRADIADAVLGEADGGAGDGVEPVGDPFGRARLGGEQQGDERLVRVLGLGEQGGVLGAELLADRLVGHRLLPGLVLGQGGRGPREGERGNEAGGEHRAVHTPSAVGRGVGTRSQ